MIQRDGKPRSWLPAVRRRLLRCPRACAAPPPTTCPGAARTARRTLRGRPGHAAAAVRHPRAVPRRLRPRRSRQPEPRTTMLKISASKLFLVPCGCGGSLVNQTSTYRPVAEPRGVEDVVIARDVVRPRHRGEAGERAWRQRVAVADHYLDIGTGGRAERDLDVASLTGFPMSRIRPVPFFSPPKTGLPS